MKFYPDKLDQLYDSIKNLKIKALLLYGPDKGYIRKICQVIVQDLDLLPTVITDSHLHVNQLEMLLNTRNFFNKRECIKFFISANQLSPAYKSAILNNEFIHFPIFIVDELPTHAEIKKFFEAEKSLASVGCYYSDPQTVTKLILSKFAKLGKKIDNAALTYCITHLQGDYQLINSELDKLIYFTHDQDLITIDDAIKVISNDITANGDNLCVYFVNKDLAKLFDELARLLQQNISMVLIIRALIRYYLNIYTVLVRVKGGMSVDEACRALSPPIFFKQLDNFKRIIRGLTVADTIVALSILQQAEVQFKLQNNSFDFYQHIYCKIHVSKTVIA